MPIAVAATRIPKSVRGVSLARTRLAFAPVSTDPTQRSRQLRARTLHRQHPGTAGTLRTAGHSAADSRARRPRSGLPDGLPLTAGRGEGAPRAAVTRFNRPNRGRVREFGPPCMSGMCDSPFPRRRPRFGESCRCQGARSRWLWGRPGMAGAAGAQRALSDPPATGGPCRGRADGLCLTRPPPAPRAAGAQRAFVRPARPAPRAAGSQRAFV